MADPARVGAGLQRAGLALCLALALSQLLVRPERMGSWQPLLTAVWSPDGRYTYTVEGKAYEGRFSRGEYLTAHPGKELENERVVFYNPEAPERSVAGPVYFDLLNRSFADRQRLLTARAVGLGIALLLYMGGWAVARRGSTRAA